MQVMINDVMSQMREIDARIEAVQRESLPIMEKTDRILALFEEGAWNRLQELPVSAHSAWSACT